jgi:hypothetical protein
MTSQYPNALKLTEVPQLSRPPHHLRNLLSPDLTPVSNLHTDSYIRYTRPEVAFTMPTAEPKVKPSGLSKELSEPIPVSESFEGMPGIRTVAGDLGNQ